MKKLKELINELEIVSILGSTEKTISEIHFDSRKVIPDSIFVAIRGNEKDGNVFIESSIKSGATVIIHNVELENKIVGVTYIMVKDSRKALAQLAQNFYDNPSQKLKLIGATGTNGKTTTVTLLFKLFRNLGHHVALLSTVENKIDDEVFEATHTTPDPVTLARFLDSAVKNGCKYAFMECSSHAIDQKRTSGLNFAGVIFTNLTQDHLDYHKTLDAYADAKKEIFDSLPLTSFAIGNLDDDRAKYMFGDTKANKYFFGIKNNIDLNFQATKINQSLDGLNFFINENKIESKLIGNFNIHNILGVYAAAKLLGIKENKIINKIRLLTPPVGRLEFVKSDTGIFCVVDYAHTPDALLNVLNTLREVLGKNSKIITVVGCGGDRDKTKRSIMGSIACKLSDLVIFTSDNPRSEDPDDILVDIVSDLPKKSSNYKCIVDRAEAISESYKKALPGDIVLVAGKGHETYQIFKDKTIHFSDIEELQKNFTNNE